MKLLTDLARLWIVPFVCLLAAVTSEGRSLGAPVLVEPTWDQVVNFCFTATGVSFADHSGPLLTRPPASCKDLKAAGQHFSGGYIIYRCSMKMPVAIPVFCDMTTDGGGWMVIQRRVDGSQNFALNWADYKDGFGNLEREFWQGNDFISLLTADTHHELRVDLEAFDGDTAYAKYSTFSVGPSASNYTLTVDGYSGTAGNSFITNNGIQFSTPDRDNDLTTGNCAASYKGGWWFNSCSNSKLNGEYFADGIASKDYTGISWYHFKRGNVSLKSSTMMIRPME